MMAEESAGIPVGCLSIRWSRTDLPSGCILFRGRLPLSPSSVIILVADLILLLLISLSTDLAKLLSSFLFRSSGGIQPWIVCPSCSRDSTSSSAHLVNLPSRHKLWSLLFDFGDGLCRTRAGNTIAAFKYLLLQLHYLPAFPLGISNKLCCHFTICSYALMIASVKILHPNDPPKFGRASHLERGQLSQRWAHCCRLRECPHSSSADSRSHTLRF